MAEYINKPNLYFKTRVGYDTVNDQGLINPKSTVYIEETGEIITHGNIFGGTDKLSEIDSRILPFRGYISGSSFETNLNSATEVGIYYLTTRASYQSLLIVGNSNNKIFQTIYYGGGYNENDPIKGIVCESRYSSDQGTTWTEWHKFNLDGQYIQDHSISIDKLTFDVEQPDIISDMALRNPVSNSGLNFVWSHYTQVSDLNIFNQINNWLAEHNNEDPKVRILLSTLHYQETGSDIYHVGELELLNPVYVRDASSDPFLVTDIYGNVIAPSRIKTNEYIPILYSVHLSKEDDTHIRVEFSDNGLLNELNGGNIVDKSITVDKLSDDVLNNISSTVKVIPISDYFNIDYIQGGVYQLSASQIATLTGYKADICFEFKGGTILLPYNAEFSDIDTVYSTIVRNANDDLVSITFGDDWSITVEIINVANQAAPIKVVTQNEFESLTKDPNTVYIIKGSNG